MSSGIDVIAKAVLSASRKSLFRRKPIFKAHKAVLSDELDHVERNLGISFPIDLRSWLLLLGYGDIDEELSFRKEWFAIIESGQLKGSTLFAQDILGNFFAFDFSGHIYFLSRSEPVFAMMSKSFVEFIDELARRDYRLEDWINTLETQRYEWQQA